MKLTLKRFRQDIVTFGKLEGIQGQPDIYTLELPWLDNKEGVSCIPAGIYNFAPFPSPTKGDIWKAVYVPGRSDIEIHNGNFASHGMWNGKAFEPQIKGCILVGLGIDEDVPMVTQSIKALEYLRKTIGKNGFSLEVTQQGVDKYS